MELEETSNKTGYFWLIILSGSKGTTPRAELRLQFFDTTRSVFFSPISSILLWTYKLIKPSLQFIFFLRRSLKHSL